MSDFTYYRDYPSTSGLCDTFLNTVFYSSEDVRWNNSVERMELIEENDQNRRTCLFPSLPTLLITIVDCRSFHARTHIHTLTYSYFILFNLCTSDGRAAATNSIGRRSRNQSTGVYRIWLLHVRTVWLNSFVFGRRERTTGTRWPRSTGQISSSARKKVITIIIDTGWRADDGSSHEIRRALRFERISRLIVINRKKKWYKKIRFLKISVKLLTRRLCPGHKKLAKSIDYSRRNAVHRSVSRTSPANFSLVAEEKKNVPFKLCAHQRFRGPYFGWQVISSDWPNN